MGLPEFHDNLEEKRKRFVKSCGVLLIPVVLVMLAFLVYNMPKPDWNAASQLISQPK